MSRWPNTSMPSTAVLARGATPHAWNSSTRSTSQPLRPLPLQPYEFALSAKTRVSESCHIMADNHSTVRRGTYNAAILCPAENASEVAVVGTENVFP